MRFPFLRSKSEPAAAPAARRPRGAGAAPEEIAVELARRQARRRLAGAVVLLAVGVVGFPLLFNSRPRPLPMDLPILPPQSSPSSQPSQPPQPVPAPASPAPAPKTGALAAPAAAPLPGLPSEPASPAARVAADGGPRPAPLPRPEPKAGPRSEPPPEPKAAVPPERKPPAAPANDGARASALLAGAAPPSASPAPPPGPAASAAAAVRFVVQVGAYADGATLHHARAQVARLGLSTYTQVVNSPGGKRTRVRVGPFDHRAEADAAAARIRRSGLPASVLAL